MVIINIPETGGGGQWGHGAMPRCLLLLDAA